MTALTASPTSPPTASLTVSLTDWCDGTPAMHLLTEDAGHLLTEDEGALNYE
ncbi:MAG: hypothetical protein LBK60_00430 [Verrucomicrobiales bacterium]|jgi:hypothetical protein|nr:hypothetical protein [Verrucomicrobiales bacterium]